MDISFSTPTPPTDACNYLTFTKALLSFLGIGVISAFSFLAGAAKFFWKRFYRRKNIISDKSYNKLFAAHADTIRTINAIAKKNQIISLAYGDPCLKENPSAPLPAEILNKAFEKSKSLRYDEEMGILDRKIASSEWRDTPLTIPYYPLKYSKYLALKQNKTYSPLTSNALICCSDVNYCLFVRRRKDAHSYPNRLHILGGGYQCGPCNDKSLRTTTLREIQEETDYQLTVQKEDLNLGSMLLEDVDVTSYFQFLYLGVNISEEQLSNCLKKPECSEGKLTKIHFNKLAKEIMDKPEDWVPSCIVQIILWLGLGAPIQGAPGGKFHLESAEDQYRQLIAFFEGKDLL